MTANEINERNRELHYYLDLIRKGTFNKCLFADGCAERPIQAHSVSRAILSTIQQNGNVIQPSTRMIKDDAGRSLPDVRFNSAPITLASTGRFACETHDKEFQIIDTPFMDFDNAKVLDLLFFRAMLMEAWTLLRTLKGITHLERQKGQIPTSPSTRHDIRLKAVLDAVNGIKPFIRDVNYISAKSPVEHIVRRVKSNRPFVAASSAGGGLDRAFDYLTGQELPTQNVQSLMGKVPNVSWSFTVIPQAKNHIVVASFLKGSGVGDYFSHLKNLNGRELTAAISSELICFCENWFLSPKVWGSYGDTKRKAIKTAFNNFEEIQVGKYTWWDKDKEKWHDFMDVPNRHQINLFRY